MILYQGIKCHAIFNKYNNGNIKIELIDPHTFIPVVEATAKSEKLDENEVAIKEYSEHSGLLNALVEAKLVCKPHRYTNTGYCNVPVCRILKRFS